MLTRLKGGLAEDGVTSPLRGSCLAGSSEWLQAASIHPPRGQSREPLLLAVIDPTSGTISK